PVTALALTCWLAGEGRFSSSRKAVRFTGLDVTVWSSDRKGPPGRLSRQGPPVLRWAVYEAGKTHARASAPDHACYAAVKDRKNSKRAALSEARKIVRQACHILTELVLAAPGTAAGEHQHRMVGVAGQQRAGSPAASARTLRRIIHRTIVLYTEAPG
ncbi:MAG: transposase, partial [Streptosporangiaceae bacterium]